jgi:hypothetical protein
MEKILNNSNGPERGTYSSPLGDFETIKPAVLNPDDVEEGDRVIVTTASGNRYMFRKSKSAGGRIKVSNEKMGHFESGTGFLFRLKENNIATKVEAMLIGIEEGDKIKGWNTTEVTEIEIRKGVDNAVKEYYERNSGKSFGAAMAQMLKTEVIGKQRD